MDSTIGRLRPGRPSTAAIVVAVALLLVFAAWAVGVRLYRADATVLQPRFAPIRRYVVAMWRPAGAAHTLIVLLSRQPDRAVQRLDSQFPPPGVRGSESSGRMWVQYGRLRSGFAARMKAAFAEVRRVAPRA